MYNFQSLNNYQDSYYLSSVAVYFNGAYLEDKIAGYQTLKVSGRETIGYKIDMKTDIPGRDGGIVIGKTLPERTITVTYRLTAKDSEEMQSRFRDLNMALHTETEVPIKFKDEFNFTYYGQVQDLGTITDESNIAVSTFTILCSDPYKFSDEHRISGNPLTIREETYPTNPDEIIIDLKDDINSVVVTNLTTGKKIILNGSYRTNDKISIQIKENLLTVNGQNRMKDLDFENTDFHEFKIQSGDRIQVLPSTVTLDLKVRSKWK